MIKNTSAPHNQWWCWTFCFLVYYFSQCLASLLLFSYIYDFLVCFSSSPFLFTLCLVWRKTQKRKGGEKKCKVSLVGERKFGGIEFHWLHIFLSFPFERKWERRPIVLEDSFTFSFTLTIRTLWRRIILLSFLSFTQNSSMLANFSEEQRLITTSLIKYLNCKFL